MTSAKAHSSFDGEAEVQSSWRSLNNNIRLLCLTAQAPPFSLLTKLGPVRTGASPSERLKSRNILLDSCSVFILPEPLLAAQMSPPDVKALELRFAKRNDEKANWPPPSLCWECPIKRERVTEGVFTLQSLTRAVISDDGSEALAKRLVPRLLSRVAWDWLRSHARGLDLPVVDVVRSGQPSLYALWRRPEIQDLVKDYVARSTAAGAANGTSAEIARVLPLAEHCITAAAKPSPEPAGGASNILAPSASEIAAQVQADVRRAVAEGRLGDDAAAAAWAKGNDAFRSEAFADAEREYTIAMSNIESRMPESAKTCSCWLLLANRSAARLRLGDHEGALQDAEQCVGSAPKFAKGHYRLAKAKLAIGERNSDGREALKMVNYAAEGLRRALKALPGDAALQALLEEALVKQRSLELEPPGCSNP